MGRRSSGSSKGQNFDSFNDILTCLAGVMVLIIILVVIDAKKTKVMIPTPLETRDTNMTPVYIEVNPKGQLLLIDLVTLQQKAEKALEDMVKEAGPGQDALLQQLALNQKAAGDDNYFVDLHSILVGSIILYPKADAQGHDMPSTLDEIKDEKTLETRDDWFSNMLKTFKNQRDTHYISFIVRSTDASFDAFKRARAAAWMQEVRVAYETFDNNEPLRFGLGGSLPGIQ